jgi:8-oxo-dGTP diphosphatase
MPLSTAGSVHRGESRTIHNARAGHIRCAAPEPGEFVCDAAAVAEDQLCAGGVVFDPTGRILVIERRNPPSAGMWSIPGGRCLPGESTAAACVREVAEETGLDVEVVRLAGTVRIPATDGMDYVVDDYVCRVLGGTLCSGDDALAAAWVSSAQLAALPTAPGLISTLAEWSCLPSSD